MTDAPSLKLSGASFSESAMSPAKPSLRSAWTVKGTAFPARALMLVDGAETDPAEAADLERVWVLFDGYDDAALTRARGLWTQLTAAGLAAQYWSEESGRWEKKSEKPARVV